jgi:hypothetical protein
LRLRAPPSLRDFARSAGPAWTWRTLFSVGVNAICKKTAFQIRSILNVRPDLHIKPDKPCEAIPSGPTIHVNPVKPDNVKPDNVKPDNPNHDFFSHLSAIKTGVVRHILFLLTLD